MGFRSPTRTRWKTPLQRQPFSQRLAGLGHDGLAGTETNRVLLDTLRGGVGGVNCLSVSPDGITLAAGSHGGLITLWNLPTRQEVTSIAGHMTLVRGLAFSPDGRTLASVGYDTTLRLWRAPGFDETDRDRLRASP